MSRCVGDDHAGDGSRFGFRRGPACARAFGSRSGYRSTRPAGAGADPRVEARLADVGLAQRDQRFLRQLRAEVAGVLVVDHLARIVLCAERARDEFIEAEPLGSAHFGDAVQRRAERQLTQHCDDVVGQDRLDQRGGRNADLVAIAGRIGDPASNSKNWVERRIVYGMPDALIRFSCATFARR